MNSTVCPNLSRDDPLCFSPPSYPFYYSPNRQLVHGYPDNLLTLAAPIVSYWTFSLIFHALDMSSWKALERYRIHESAEVKKRNLVSRTQVVLAVIFQQVLQTALGLLVLGSEHHATNHPQQLRRIAIHIEPVLLTLGAQKTSPLFLKEVTEFMYWWAIPAFQFFCAMFIIDTWQYFLHRFMHVNKWMYRQFHSWHHRLYVPYAFGALYNHPFEGFILDSVGAIVAETLTRMGTRQSMLFFAIASAKTVDDHCGYNFPWDPLQMFSGNNADYHDIHHQVAGIKSNFAQPFFIHWDTLLGTRMTRQEFEQRRAKSKKTQ